MAGASFGDVPNHMSQLANRSQIADRHRSRAFWACKKEAARRLRIAENRHQNVVLNVVTYKFPIAFRAPWNDSGRDQIVYSREHGYCSGIDRGAHA